MSQLVFKTKMASVIFFSPTPFFVEPKKPGHAAWFQTVDKRGVSTSRFPSFYVKIGFEMKKCEQKVKNHFFNNEYLPDFSLFSKIFISFLIFIAEYVMAVFISMAWQPTICVNRNP